MTTSPIHDVKTCAVDFDQTIHPYSRGWTGPDPDDEPPIKGAGEFLRALKVKGFKVVIFSVRAETAEGLAGIKNWLLKYNLMQFIDEITYVKPKAIAYVDDRAVPFRGDWVSVMREVDALVKRGDKTHR